MCRSQARIAVKMVRLLMHDMKNYIEVDRVVVKIVATIVINGFLNIY